MSDAWNELVTKYANGRQVCNCGGAYYTPCGHGFDGNKYRTDMLTCKDGCSAALLDCKNEIAKLVSKELERLHKMSDALLAHCPEPECGTCGEIVCPHGEWLHFHHDGCPACWAEEIGNE